MKAQILIRTQLEDTLKPFKALRKISPPFKGWIRAIRDSLGMNGRQLAKRLGVSPARVTRLEQDELSGAVTIKTMRNVAEALDCVFVYGLVPKEDLETIIKRQAEKVATDRFERTSHTMALEAQGLSEKDKKKVIKAMATEIIRGPAKKLWDK